MEDFNGGWIRQEPSDKDYDLDHLTSSGLRATLSMAGAPPASVDLRAYDVPIVDQGNLGSCTANALAGLLGWYIKKTTGMNYVASRLFTYYMTRLLEGRPANQDTGATIRGTIGSLAVFGVPPETSSLKGIVWPYTISKFSQIPPMAVSLAALAYQGVTYALIDKPGTQDVLGTIKSVLAAGFPMEFGFDVFSSYPSASKTGIFAVPKPGEQIVGGHAVMAVGYDDSMQALLIRNSWGLVGNAGYFWLPYWYILNNHAADFWTLTSARFINLGQFV
jgi:C1A family cysteine protease